MSVLILAEHNHKTLNPATRHVVTAATKMGGGITLLVVGHNAASVAAEAGQLMGVDAVWHCDHAAYAHFLAENVATLIAKHASQFTHVLAPATSNGKNILPRAAGLCGMAQISDIIGVESADTFLRPIYAGNAIALVKSTDAIKFITVRPTAFEAAAPSGGKAAVTMIEPLGDSGLSQYIGAEISQSTRPELASARIVVSGGRALGSAENFKTVLEPLADKLGAAVGASRAAVDAGYVPNDLQVGQTGKVVAPDLYLAVGVSGAIQHLAGMKDSKVIVAINKDPDAPIFQVADYGLVADLFQAVPELKNKL